MHSNFVKNFKTPGPTENFTLKSKRKKGKIILLLCAKTTLKKKSERIKQFNTKPSIRLANDR